MTQPVTARPRSRRFTWLSASAMLLIAAASFLRLAPAFAAEDKDQTLHAMRDELARSKARLVLPPQAPPYYLEYRLLDMEQKTIVASFGDLVSSTSSRNRFMDVNARVGNYQLDSSNFVGGDDFRGSFGSTGGVGIDGDYNSLRQDLWLATDQAYKEALNQLSSKRAFLLNLTRPPEIPDFSKSQPVTDVQPKLAPDWSSRNWEQEARDASSVLRGFPELYSTRITYHMVVMNYYLMTTEGTEVRVPRVVAAIEASFETQSDDGYPLHNYYSVYAATPADLPPPAVVRQGVEKAARDLIALRNGPAAPDYAGPVLFEPAAAGALLAQILAPSIAGARPPLAAMQGFDSLLERVGGRSDWSGRVGSRVLPTGVTLVDDPARNDFQGAALIGGYHVDEEGVKAESVEVVDKGMLKQLLMSRRPGPDFDVSNGHGRGYYLSDTRPAMSNLFFQATETKSPEDLRNQFFDLCRQAGRTWCVVVRKMDNPAVALSRQDDVSEYVGAMAGSIGAGDRLPLLLYRVYVSDGHEEPLRGALLRGFNIKALRTIAGIGNDFTPFNYMQSQQFGFAGTALSAFGSSQGGLPTSLVAPSLLFEDVDVRGARGEPRRAPRLPPPDLN
ncbi:MAG TPA: metallopeptidase TldD-related protein [Candidatus Acidoferrales bacterium]|nr:metallopeptidase TldD-related protein [Candidatus Acidoferrales bacterium]